jgi:hypothetical protein
MTHDQVRTMVHFNRKPTLATHHTPHTQTPPNEITTLTLLKLETGITTLPVVLWFFDGTFNYGIIRYSAPEYLMVELRLAFQF